MKPSEFDESLYQLREVGEDKNRIYWRIVDVSGRSFLFRARICSVNARLIARNFTVIAITLNTARINKLAT